MKNRKINVQIGLLMSLFLLSFGLYAQKTIKQTTVSIYEYGKKQTTSCEANFENLFRNWNNKLIKNSHETKLLSYKFIECINDSNTIDKYACLMTTSKTLMPTSKRSTSTNTTHTVTEFNFYPETAEELYRRKTANLTSMDTTGFWNALENENTTLKKGLKKMIRIGYYAYTVEVEVKNKIYTNYVICDPKSKKVVCDVLFIGINFWQ